MHLVFIITLPVKNLLHLLKTLVKIRSFKIKTLIEAQLTTLAPSILSKLISECLALLWKGQQRQEQLGQAPDKEQGLQIMTTTKLHHRLQDPW